MCVHVDDQPVLELLPGGGRLGEILARVGTRGNLLELGDAGAVSRMFMNSTLPRQRPFGGRTRFRPLPHSNWASPTTQRPCAHAIGDGRRSVQALQPLKRGAERRHQDRSGEATHGRERVPSANRRRAATIKWNRNPRAPTLSQARSKATPVPFEQVAGEDRIRRADRRGSRGTRRGDRPRPRLRRLVPAGRLGRGLSDPAWTARMLSGSGRDAVEGSGQTHALERTRQQSHPDPDRCRRN